MIITITVDKRVIYGRRKEEKYEDDDDEGGEEEDDDDMTNKIIVTNSIDYFCDLEILHWLVRYATSSTDYLLSH